MSKRFHQTVINHIESFLERMEITNITVKLMDKNLILKFKDQCIINIIL